MSAAPPNQVSALTRTMSRLTSALSPRPPPTTKSPPAMETKARSCIACTDSLEDSLDLVKPCRACEADYCKTCLSAMFEGATNDATRMPPRCCTFLQIHTAYLQDEAATSYRERFEEFITRDKTYCPSPKCSAFISERLLRVDDGGEKAMSMQEIMLSVLDTVTKSPHSRFFRGELPITEQSGNAAVLTEYMDLSIVRERVTSGIYNSTVDMEPDMRLIVHNARNIHHAGHPVVQTANLFLNTYLQALAAVLDKVHRLAAQTPPQDHFLCPKCHIAICMECKQIEHGSAACDTTAQDHELAMLEQFGYKRCPLCKHAVKKMYGCSHMQCLCGSHWCYYCQKPINQCDGGCAERAEDSEAEEEEYDEEDEDEDENEDERDEEDEEPEPRDAITIVGEHSPGHSGSPPPLPATDIHKSPMPVLAQPPPRPMQSHTIINLDAGGARRWADAQMDFGDEPEEDGVEQIWACRHSLQPYELYQSEEGVDRGDVSKMECNKCFCGVQPLPLGSSSTTPPPQKPRLHVPRFGFPQAKKETKIAPSLEQKDASPMAMECLYCYLVVCETCAKKFRPAQES